MRVIWERRPRETAKAFHAFGHYLHLPTAVRSIDVAWRGHQTECRDRHPAINTRAEKGWETWSASYQWVDRAAAWEARQAHVAGERLAQEQIDARVRHARIANAALQALTVPARAALEALQDPRVLARLVADAQESSAGILRLVEAVTQAARALPGLVQVERLALGMTTDKVALVTLDTSSGSQIPTDPESVELAIALVDRMSTVSRVQPPDDD